MSKLSFLFEQMGQIEKKGRKAVLNLIDQRVDEGNEKLYKEMHIQFKYIQQQFGILKWMIGILYAIVTAILAKVIIIS